MNATGEIAPGAVVEMALVILDQAQDECPKGLSLVGIAAQPSDQPLARLRRALLGLGLGAGVDSEAAELGVLVVATGDDAGLAADTLPGGSRDVAALDVTDGSLREQTQDTLAPPVVVREVE